MDISAFKPAIVYTIYIAATQEKVWEALTSAEFSRRYFHGFAVEYEMRVGGAFIVRAPDGSVHVSGKVYECDPPRKLTITWDVNWPGLIEALGSTLVTYEIAQAGKSVKLTLIQSHDRPIGDDILSGGRQGWPAILSSLKSLLERGEALTIEMEPPARMLAALKKLGVKLPGQS
ncbi:MAG: ATPase [Bradyrhizobiaceae bacterium]|nr:MAG: ATPase [Bradyrhizobiaceae bacterium]